MRTLIARNGQKGSWYIDVDGVAPYIPVLHYVLIGPNGVPWPLSMQFLNGLHYDQPCPGPNWMRKADQIRRINQLGGIVCMTRDFWSHPPGSPDRSAIRMRLQEGGYVGLFRAHGARFDPDHHQRFVLGDCLYLLRRPGE